jgi:hypothetical protein
VPQEATRDLLPDIAMIGATIQSEGNCGGRGDYDLQVGGAASARLVLACQKIVHACHKWIGVRTA